MSNMNSRVLLYILGIGIVCSYISFSIYNSNNKTAIRKDQEKLEIIQYQPVFKNIDDYIAVGGKIVSEEVIIKSSQPGKVYYKGDKKHYKKGDTICNVECDAEGRFQQAEAELNEKVRKLDRLIEAQQKSPGSIATSTIEDAEFELQKAQGIYSAALSSKKRAHTTAPFDCTLQYPIVSDGAPVYSEQELFKIASTAKKVQGQISVRLKSEHNIKAGDQVRIIDSKHRVHYADINMINKPVNNTAGSVIFETELIDLDDDVNVVQVLFAKQKQIKCVVPSEFVYQNRVLVMMKEEHSLDKIPMVVTRICKTLNDGRIVADVCPGEKIVMPISETLSAEYINKIYATDPTNIMTVSKREYNIDDEGAINIGQDPSSISSEQNVINDEGKI